MSIDEPSDSKIVISNLGDVANIESSIEGPFQETEFERLFLLPDCQLNDGLSIDLEGESLDGSGELVSRNRSDGCSSTRRSDCGSVG